MTKKRTKSQDENITTEDLGNGYTRVRVEGPNSVQRARDFIDTNFDNPAYYQGDLKDLEVVAYDPKSHQSRILDDFRRSVGFPTASEMGTTYKYVEPSKPKVDDGFTDAERERYLHNLEKSGFNFDYANRVLKADRHASQYNPENFLKATGINALDPTQWVGALSDKLTGKVDENGNPIGFWQSLGYGNSGLVTDNFMRNHPILGTTVNMIGGGATIGLGNKVFNLTRPLVQQGYALTQNAARQGYNTARDFLWLTKTYNNVGTGLKNPHIREQLWDLSKDPSLSRNFIETYSRNNRAGLNLAQIKEALPQLQQLQREFGVAPKYTFRDYTPVAEQIGKIRGGLQDGRRIAKGYTEGLEFLKSRNKVLYDIAKESPQYLNQIVSDFKSGNITNLEEYVKSLIRQSNTFVRRMDLTNGEDPVEAFSQIRGHTMGSQDFAMDVGNPEVVYHPIWSKGYGNQAALYTPREVNPQGPVETWWSQRMPKFQDQSISIDANGLHTNRYGMLNHLGSESQYNANMYLEQQGIPTSYGRTSSHMIFKSPNKGASISDQFIITPYKETPDLRYTLGYKNGGKLCKKLKNI